MSVLDNGFEGIFVKISKMVFAIFWHLLVVRLVLCPNQTQLSEVVAPRNGRSLQNFSKQCKILGLHNIFPLIVVFFESKMVVSTIFGIFESFKMVLSVWVSIASLRITLSKSQLRDICSLVFGAPRVKKQPLHFTAYLLQMNYSFSKNIYQLDWLFTTFYLICE